MLRHLCRCRPAYAGLVLSCTAFTFATPGMAATARCVADSAQLAAALVDANAANADPQFLIKLRTGTFSATPSGFRVAPQRGGQILRLSGGYSDAGCQNKTYGPARTTLVGATNRHALEFTLGIGDLAGGQLHLQDVDLTNSDFGGASGGACLSGTVYPGNTAVVERVATRDCRAPWGTDASIWLANHGILTLRNVQARSGTANYNGGIGVITSGSGLSRLAQVSVTTTQSSAGNAVFSGLRLSNDGNAVAHLSNSVIWGNDSDPGTADLAVHGPGITLTRVHYGTLLGTPAANLAPGTGDPGFVAANDPHLRADSILVDSGATDPVGGSGPLDLDGNLRTQGVALDVGAHERPVPDAIFWNGFDFTD
ncbi:hypothetical protein [Dokdonella sp.]|uniref:hypothetical protein n=1 Tax=Dokdonella sp. TaxID=2291710 RepID=UPI00261F90D8|nr:hypothetical protein [Dokdonella sp.]